MNGQDFWKTPLAQLINQPILQDTFEQAEVIEMLGIKPYQLRFWESEFDCIRAKNTDYILRYTTDDLKLLIRIKKYLMEDQLTVEKAKALIDSELKANFLVVEENNVQTESINILESQQELAQKLSISSDALEESLNMNSLFEEMSLETFKQAETPLNLETNVDNETRQNLQTKIRSAISSIREKLKAW